MENRENLENAEDRESRDVIGRKKGPVLASVILAVVLIIFTRGKGLNPGRNEGMQEAESGPAQALDRGEENAVTLGDVLSDQDAYAEVLPETVEILVDGDHVSVNGWNCRDGDELKSFLTAFTAAGRRYEIVSGGAQSDALQWVREAFESLDIPFAEASEK